MPTVSMHVILSIPTLYKTRYHCHKEPLVVNFAGT